MTALPALLLGVFAGGAADRLAAALTETAATARTMALAAIAGGLLGAVTAVRWAGWDQLIWGSCLWALLALTDSDLRSKLLPDVLTLPLLAAGLVVSFAHGELISGLLGLVTAGAALVALTLIGGAAFGREAFGWGDVKLGAALGAWVGWPAILALLLVAFVLGGIVGLLVMAVRAARRAWAWGQVEIPFGPFLAAGAAALIIGGWPMVAPATAQPAWVTLSPPQCACSLQVPADWSYEPGAGGMVLMTLAPPRADGAARASVVVSRESLAQSATLDQYFAAGRRLVERTLAGYKGLRVDSVVVNGRPARLHFYTWTPTPAAPLYQIQLVTVAGSTGYAVTATTPVASPRLTEDLALLMRILATFRVGT